MVKRVTNFGVPIVLFLCSFYGCSFERYLIIKGTFDARSNITVKIENSGSSKDTLISFSNKEIQLKESIKVGRLTIELLDGDKSLRTLIARPLGGWHNIEIQLFDEEGDKFDEITLTDKNLNDDFEWFFDINSYNLDNKECDEKEWELRTYKFVSYGEILYPEGMDLTDIKLISKLIWKKDEHPIAFLGAGRCDKLFSKKNNKYAKNEYGAEFYRRNAKNVCRMKHTGHGCDTMDVIVDFNDFGKMDIVDRWGRIYKTENMKTLKSQYKIYKITRKNGDWHIVE
ncbi:MULTISPECIES: hypothetical protein [unclassified Fibrobacter]|uniref:hypothetical protein n=1 Tax=unclassified Fibrobacter TaxID=2634177 RepID=UPI000919F020|nr:MULTISPECIES: hypothetical protein [unclassified Fibrobacter]SHL87459.1 hypothetical protein SAMN05720765_1325 [Fibrobacter sp. UWH6]